MNQILCDQEIQRPIDRRRVDAPVQAGSQLIQQIISPGLAGNAQTMSGEKPVFALDAVSFSVEGRQLVKQLTLSLPAGRITGLIGHNGSGKSTLLKMLARQQRPSGGTIRFEDRPLAAWKGRDFARRLAYLPQYTPSASGMLVKELVALGRYPWHGALRPFGRIDRQKTEEAIELTGIAPFADRLVDTLSGGERQRVWLAMLVAQDAGCLLLDEPISALDISHQIEVLSLIRSLSQEKGLAVIVVLHDVNMAARYCDQIVALKRGSVVAQAAPDQIMRAEALKLIFGIEMVVMSHPRSGLPVTMPG